MIFRKSAEAFVDLHSNFTSLDGSYLSFCSPVLSLIGEINTFCLNNVVNC